jgi:glucose/mannose-6-phosphate isomerase
MDMKPLISGFAQQLKLALDISASSKLSPYSQPISNVVIAGMGGSGIGGNLVSAWTANTATVPITISKSYETPNFISSSTLFIACSFSGGTEETIAASEQALAKNAKIVAITSGGKLGSWCTANGIDQINIPGESGSPRASIGYSFVQLLYILNFYGLTPSSMSADIQETIELLQTEEQSITESSTQVAKVLKGKFAIIYSDSKLEAVIIRTQQQIAENSKQLCHTNVLRESSYATP